MGERKQRAWEAGATRERIRTDWGVKKRLLCEKRVMKRADTLVGPYISLH